MKKILFISSLLLGTFSYGQVKIGNNPTVLGTSSVLELESTSRALVITRVATTSAITNPVNGMLVYDISSQCVKFYQSNGWTNCLIVGSAATDILVQIGNEADDTNVASTVTASQLVTLGVNNVVVANQAAYQAYIDANPNAFSAPATLAEVQAAVNAVNTAVTSGGNAVVASYSCSTASLGTLTQGLAVSGVTQTITANVTTAGTYSITAVANGVTFAASGTFAGTGSQDVVLTATGTPTSAGSNTFTLTTTPSCSFTRITNSGTITLAQNQNYLIASVFDQDYLPYVAPTVAATATSAAADGTNETITVNIQGKLSFNGVTLRIPVVSVVGSGTLGAHSSTVNVPASLTEDGIDRDIELSWPATSFNSNTFFVDVTIKSIEGVLNIKKLDINSGVGVDALGIVLGQLVYPYNSAGDTSTLSVRAVALVPDRMFNVTDNTGTNTLHRMFYQPVVAEDGTVWLNNNLGAHYANASHPDFNPVQQATAIGDYLASGSVFQWGRSPDGHELLTHTGSQTATPLYGTTATLNNAPTNALFITTTGNEWRTTVNNTLWNDGLSANQPCPRGFRVPSRTQQQSWTNAAKITNTTSAYNSALRMSGNRTRSATNGVLGGGFLVYHHSSGSVGSSVAGNMYIAPTSSTASYFSGSKAVGYALRCIKN